MKSLLKHVSNCHICISFQYLQEWWLYHFPGCVVLIPQKLFAERIFPSVQSEPSLGQLEAISSCPVIGCLPDPHLPTTSFQPLVENNRVTSKTSFFLPKYSQLPQSLLIRLVLTEYALYALTQTVDKDIKQLCLSKIDQNPVCMNSINPLALWEVKVTLSNHPQSHSLIYGSSVPFCHLPVF